ncbi:MAG: hypothetical protein GXY54_07875 [Deltaproteobacteria bacterium]|nr:hypothetical protein [Deltaproteobacteria bacterium]
MVKKFPFCDAAFGRLLQGHGLNSFDGLWELMAPAVEEPNQRRGGWSGVWFLSLSDEKGEMHHFYLKRQQNHLSRRGPLLSARPTFYREFVNILQCRHHNLPSLEVVYYDERKKIDGGGGIRTVNHQAMLITLAIENYQPFSHVLAGWDGLSGVLRCRYLRHIALTAAVMHGKRLSHNSFYPKHLLVNLEKNPPVRMIDLERMGFQWRRVHQSVVDLETLIRRSAVLSPAEIEYFLNQYWQANGCGRSFAELKKLVFERHEKRRNL